MLAHSREFLLQWLPEGRMAGKEWVCGDISGKKGKSFSVNTETGVWSDFAKSNVSGGDLVSLYAAIKACDQGMAYRELAEQYGFVDNQTTAVAVLDKPVEKNIMPPIEANIEGAFDHSAWGAPTLIHPYRSYQDDLMFYICRYKTPDGKQFLPWTWHKDGYWQAKGWNGKKPLYGLQLLKKRPNHKLMFVEGEKAADEARRLCELYYNVLTWPGGANAWHRADYSLITEKEVVLFRDNDDPGEFAMTELGRMLITQNCKIKWIDTKGMPEGWDIADEGFKDWDEFYAWAKDRINHDWKPPAQTVINNDNRQLTIHKGEEDGEPHIVTKSERQLWDDLGLSLAKSSQTPFANYDNVRRALDKHKPFDQIVWYDEFQERFYTKYESDRRREWTDHDDGELATYFQREFGISKMAKETIRTAVTGYAKKHKRNEVRDWVDGLKHDGVDRIGRYFHTYYGSPLNGYTVKAGMNFWISLIARIYLPGCKVDNMIVLEGSQGNGKTESLKALGGDWYVEINEPVQNKDFFAIFTGKLIIEIAELDSFSKADVTRIKQVISCASDTYRTPYEARPQDHPRRSIFVGSTNEDAYLRDVTGARRFWPVETTKIKVDEVARDREQLFAQAKILFDEGNEWHVMPIDDTLTEQEKRRQRDDWEQVIEDYIQFKDEVNSVDIAVNCLKVDVAKLDRSLQMRITSALKSMKWRRHFDRDKSTGKTRRVWRRG